MCIYICVNVYCVQVCVCLCVLCTSVCVCVCVCVFEWVCMNVICFSKLGCDEHCQYNKNFIILEMLYNQTRCQ
jgi:hypothetical protein